jgi:hypothetical protein
VQQVVQEVLEAERDVHSGGIDAQGERDNRAAVRSRVFGVDHQPVTEQLGEELQKFARLKLEEEYPYVVVDARYEKSGKTESLPARQYRWPSGSTGRDDDACWEWSRRIGKSKAVGKSFCWD